MVRSKSCEAVRCGGEKGTIMEAVEMERVWERLGLTSLFPLYAFHTFSLKRGTSVVVSQWLKSK